MEFEQICILYIVKQAAKGSRMKEKQNLHNLQYMELTALKDRNGAWWGLHTARTIPWLSSLNDRNDW